MGNRNRTTFPGAPGANEVKAMILKKTLAALACPVQECRKPLILAVDEKSLRCTGCGRIYPVRDGIPVLLIDEAVKSE
jgi:uncharacterized protein